MIRQSSLEISPIWISHISKEIGKLQEMLARFGGLFVLISMIYFWGEGPFFFLRGH
jgi:hypothetical protein